MESEVGGLPVLVDGIAIEDRGNVFHKPSDDRVVGWDSGLDSSLQGRLQSSQLVFDNLNGSLGPSVRGTLTHSAEFADSLGKSRVESVRVLGDTSAAGASQSFLGHLGDGVLLIGLVDQLWNTRLFDKIRESGDGRCILGAFGIADCGEHSVARVKAASEDGGHGLVLRILDETVVSAK
jgi:hypothetical protein